MGSVDAACRTPDSAVQSSGALQIGAVDNIFCGGSDSAASVSPLLRELKETEDAVAAVADLVAGEVSMVPSRL